MHSRLCILDSVPSQSVYSRTLSTLDSSTIESTETRARIRKHRECENADYRECRAREYRESRAQRVREFRVESAESARVRSREEGAQCTMRAQCESAESECRDCES